MRCPQALGMCGISTACDITGLAFFPAARSSGPADAQLCAVLAWAVRSSVLQLDKARLLARVHGMDGSPAGAGPAVAAEYGLSWAALRQRCDRIARQVGQAAVTATSTARFSTARCSARPRHGPGRPAPADERSVDKPAVHRSSLDFSPSTATMATPRHTPVEPGWRR